jgi:AraC family transcriptional regulator
MWRSRENDTEPMRVYTDAPARCIRLTDGHLDFDAPCNVIVQRHARHLDLRPAETRLSIRCAFGGQSHFEVDRHRYVVHDDRYLLFNLGQEVATSIQSDTPVECFNVTFQPEFVGEVFRSLITPPTPLLDEPKGKPTQSFSFNVQTYPHDDLVSPVLFRLRETLGQEEATQGWLSEQFHLLLERLLQRQGRVSREIEAIPGIRQSTRVEIYQRLSLARDFMEASLQDPITLIDCANIACLSPHHFLRLFKQVYGETPHQYLTWLRLERALFLLRKTQLPVTEICFLVGFESLGSFSTLFKRRYGKPPSVLREEEP